MRRLLVLPLLLALVACGDKAAVSPRASDPPSSSPPAHSYAADGVVLRVSSEGGLAPVDRTRSLPYFTLYGDGRVMTLGAQPAIYPGAAMPSVRVTRVDAATVDWFAAEARKAGVDGQERDYGDPRIADATDTVFHLSDATGTVDLRVYALSEGDSGSGYTEDQQANRERLAAFRSLLTDPPKWPGTHTEEGEYEPASVAIYAGAYVADPQITHTTEIPWRGPDPAAGETHRAGLCTVVTGDALKATIGSLRRATTLTRWTYEGKAYAFRVRPLLPDEKGCLD